jgi:hypothetical protein
MGDQVHGLTKAQLRSCAAISLTFPEPRTVAGIVHCDWTLGWSLAPLKREQFIDGVRGSVAYARACRKECGPVLP